MGEDSKPLAVQEIAALARRRSMRAVWLNDIGEVSWSEFGITVEAARQECLDRRVQPGSVVEVTAEERLSFLAWVFGAAGAGAVVAPLRLAKPAASPWRNFVEIGWRVSDGRLERVGTGAMARTSEPLFAELRARRHPGLILATGGTTGTP